MFAHPETNEIGLTLPKIDEYIQQMKVALDAVPIEDVERVVDIIHRARLHDRQVFIMGNGGSAATASHFVCDLSKNTRKKGWPLFRVIGLTDNMSLFSAYANDEGYENVFVQQLASLVRPEDIVIGISASGKSPNVIKAIELANQVNAITIGFSGFDGGHLANIVDISVHIKNNIIEQVEDIHMMLEHIIITALRERLVRELKPYTLTPVLPQRADFIGLNATHEDGTTIITPELPGSEHAKIGQRLFNEVQTILESQSNFNEVMPHILSAAIKYMGASSGSVVLFGKDGRVEHGYLAYDGRIEDQPGQQMEEVIDNGLAGWVKSNRQAALVGNTREDPRWLPRGWENQKGVSRSAISAPLIIGGQLAGVLTLVHQETNGFSLEDLAILTAMIVTVSLNISKIANKIEDD